MNPETARFWIGIDVAELRGSIVGFEPQIRGKRTGIGTHSPICLGTNCFMLGAATDVIS